MDFLFSPKTIAVVGASRHKEKLGYQIYEKLISGNFQGQVFPVNPEAYSILGQKVYGSLSNIPVDIDLAVIVIPAKFVVEAVKEAVKKQVKAAIIISAGFAEIGAEGHALQEQIKDVIKASPIRILGPNCLGVFNTANNFDATFASPKLVKGSVSAIFQSGALGVAFLDWASSYGFGLAKFVSLGNKVDIEETEIIEFLKNDPDTKIIALYLENVSNPNKFLKVCRETSAIKPIIILKGGTSNLGAKAAFSHTAAMVGSSLTTKALFSQSNLIVAQTIEEMLNLIMVLNTEPPMQSDKICLITNAGGPGILATDMVGRLGMKLPSPPEKDILALKKALPKAASFNNPFDLSGEAKASEYNAALQFALHADYGAIILLLTAQTVTEVENTAEVISQYAKSPKPIIASFLGDKSVAKGKEILLKNLIPHFSDPELAVFALWKIAAYWKKRLNPIDLINIEKQTDGREMLGDPFILLQTYSVPIPLTGIATNLDVAYQIIGRIGYPVVVKNIAKFGEHKSKAGKVVLNISSDQFLLEAIKKVGFPVLVQSMVNAPFEVIIGAKRDQEFGVTLSFGWGGVYAEEINDIAARILPLTEVDLDEMIRETKIGQILIREKVDLSPIKNILIDVAQIMIDFPQITELDLNPVKVSEREAICVDTRYNVEGHNEKRILNW